MSDLSPYEPPQSSILKAPVPSSDGFQALKKELKGARILLIIVGVLTLGLVALSWNNIQKSLDASEAQLERQGLTLQQGLENDPAAADQLQLGYVFLGVGVAMGIGFIVLGCLVYRFPFGAPLIGLILYAVDFIGGMMLNPEDMYKGILMKILISVALVKAVQAGYKWKKQSAGLMA